MVVPVAAAQQLTRSFAATFAIAVAIGVSVTIGGTVTSYYQDVPPGATIVLLAIAAFMVLTALAAPLARRRAKALEAAAGDPAECVIPKAREAAGAGVAGERFRPVGAPSRGPPVDRRPTGAGADWHNGPRKTAT